VRRVYLEGRFRGLKMHSLYDELIQYPPVGYRFVTDVAIERSNIHALDRSIRMKSSVLMRLSDYLRPLAYLLYCKIRDAVGQTNAELTYSSQHLVFRKEPWIVDLEFVSALVAYGRVEPWRRIIQETFRSDYCRKILPWSDWAKKTVLSSLDCRGFEEKIETVHLAVHPKRFVKTEKDDKTRILFVGTGNPSNIAYSFEHKGGREVLEAFKLIENHYRNMELMIKSYVPLYWKELFSAYKNIRILEGVIPRASLEKLFRSADMFVFPAHETLCNVVLEAMSYGLPVIATDVYDVSEAVRDYETGLLIKPSQGVPYYRDNLTPNNYTANFASYILCPDLEMTKQLAENIIILIEDEKLRKRIGQAARKEIESGEFSIKTRNEKLKKIFDEALDP